MATFAYTVLEPNGQRKSGFLDANTKEAAVQQLTGSGSYLIEISERAAREGFGSRDNQEKKKGGKPAKADVALFTRRLADLADAGLPLDRVLQVVAEQSENQQLTDLAEEALEDVRAGSSVSAALAKHPKVFTPIFTSTLEAGEQSGQFSEVAGRLAEFQEKEVARKSQIVSALIYPSILLFTAVGVVVFILAFVIPKLSTTFAAQGDKLPGSTKLLLAISDFISNQWMLIIGGIVGTVVGLKLYFSTENGAYFRDGLLMRIPVIGKIVTKSTVFQRSADEVKLNVREGVPIAQAMRDARAFPPVLTHMVAVGEETGDLPRMLNRVSDSLDFEVDNGLRRATALVEPVIVLVMGGFVAFVVLSVLLPIFNAQDVVK
ncbi:MAG: type II secretion system F family protein [Fimbriimonadaceae bacterium]|nr:type II secretion system F family protein [Fimbriimonadaceae bacterium]